MVLIYIFAKVLVLNDYWKTILKRKKNYEIKFKMFEVTHLIFNE